MDTGTRPPGRPRSQRTYDVIMSATVALLVEVGYVSLTFDAVAARARVGKSTIYRWWPTKADLVVEALSTKLRVEPLVATGDSRTDLRNAVALNYYTVTESRMGGLLPSLVADLSRYPEPARRLEQLLEPRRASEKQILTEIIERGDLPPDTDPDVIIDLYRGALFYRMIFRTSLSPAIIDQITDMILSGDPPRLVVDL